jgi:3-deoxy-7-phosphoheptulonate synthase/chorismate mutase
VDISKLRQAIDSYNETIFWALSDRTKILDEIRKLKRAAGVPMFDPVRKAELISNLIDLASATDCRCPPEMIEAVFGAIHDASLRYIEGSSKRDEPLPLESAFLVQSNGSNGSAATIGVDCESFYIAGPCAVETRELLVRVLDVLAALGVRLVRGGAYKPRTSPNSFQGLGRRGLEILAGEANSRHQLVVSEVLDGESLAAAVELVDIIQIGTRNMSNFSLLKRVGRAGKPVLLKRGYGSTLDEWLKAAAYLVDGGCTKVVFCERGIRTFEPSTRNTLDLSTVALLADVHKLPVVVDVSHAAGRRDILESLTRAAFAVGAHGVMIEVHGEPQAALSDAHQQISPSEFARLALAVSRGVPCAPKVREIL